MTPMPNPDLARDVLAQPYYIGERSIDARCEVSREFWEAIREHFRAVLEQSRDDAEPITAERLGDDGAIEPQVIDLPPIEGMASRLEVTQTPVGTTVILRQSCRTNASIEDAMNDDAVDSVWLPITTRGQLRRLVELVAPKENPHA